MKQNMGTIDRAVRVLVAAVIGFLYYNGTITGTVGIILLVLAAVFVVTALIGVCPLYLPFHLSTKGEG